MKNTFIALLGIAPLLTTGCLETKSLSGQNSAQSQYTGCTSAVGLNNSSIQVNFEFPGEGDKVIIYRNGIEIGNSTSANINSITDFNLTEGVTYTYTCNGYNGPRPIIGVNQIQAAPLNTNAPTFAGIVSATVTSTSTATVQWAPESASGAKATVYKVYSNPGLSVNWNATPRALIPANSGIIYQLTELGDELTYSIGVRACTHKDICDSNTAFRQITLADSGAPRTTGASAITAANLNAYLSVPWTDSQGAVAKRQIFMCKVTSGSTCNFAVTPVKTYAATDLAHPPTELVYENIDEYANYRFKVVDVDPTGNSNNDNHVLALSTGDLTPPSFGGITNLARGTPANTSAQFSFIALPREGTGDTNALTGVSNYLLYVNSATYPTVATNACLNTAPTIKISALGFPPGLATYTVTGLKERTNYSFCLRAQDLAGNTSGNNSESTVLTADLTPPAFDGLQTLSFNSGTRKINFGWNAAPNADLRNYTLKVWKNTATPTAPQITSFTLTPSTLDKSLGTSDFAMNDYDVIYAVVDACDNAADLGLSGINDNCTSTTSTNTKIITLPDINPPLGFTGIKPSLTSPQEGKALVEWYTPSPWTSDYYGFRIYQVNTSTNALTLLTSCLCTTPGACTNADNQCLVSGLTPARTYRLHVRAFDAVGNETSYITPDVSFADLKISDTTAPTFSSGLSISLLTLNWTSATDNQYAGEGNLISYKVYRKFSSTFTNATDPTSDGTMLTTTTATTYTDNTLSLVGTYYYTICAVDSAGNRRCDGNVKSITVNDITPPTIGSFTSNKSSDDTELKTWNLNWTISDDVTASSALRVRIYRKTSATDAGVLASISDTKIMDQVGTTSMSGLTGDTNSDQFINYLLWIQDAAGNISTRTITVKSVNSISITSVASTIGSISGGRTIVIKGRGFSKGTGNGYGTGTTIKVGAQDCGSINVMSSRYISCVTPSSVAGIVSVSATNPEGSTAIKTNAYTYIGISPSDICGNPSSWGSTFAAGVGSSGNPFIICTPTHLNNIFQTTPINYVSSNYYYTLGDNIDLSSSPMSVNSCGTATTLFFIGTMNGNGHSILNNNVTTATAYSCIFQLGHAGSTTTLKNIGFLNHTYTTTYATAGQSAYISLFGNGGYANVVLENVSALVTLNQTANVNLNVRMGGLFYAVHNSHIATSLTDSDLDTTFNTNSTNGANIGGVDATHTYGTLTVARSRISVTHVTSGNYNSNIAGITAANGAGASHTAMISISQSDVKVKVSSASANNASTIKIGGLINSISAGITVDQTRVDVVTKNILSGSQAGFIGGASGSGFLYLNISDSYLTGNLDGVGSRAALVLGASAYTASTSVNLQRILSTMSWGYYSGNRSATGYLYAADGTSAFNGSLTASGLLYDSTVGDSSTSPGSSTNLTGYGFSTTALRDQNTGTNPYGTYGYDFTAGTGKWKWCYSNDRPYLMWETCQ